MLTTIIVRLVDLSRRFAVAVIALALLISLGLGWFVVNNFKINTDVNQLLSSDLPWRAQEKDLEQAFPQKNDNLVVVIDGDTPDIAENAAAELAKRIQAMPERFSYVSRPDALPFFHNNAFLFLPQAELSGILEQMVQAQPMLGALSSDPSLRGFFGLINMMLQGLKYGQTDYARLEQPIKQIGDTVEAAIAGQDKPLAWESLMQGHQASLRELRKFIITKPILNYSELEPGKEASDAIRAMAKDMQLTPDHGVRVRLTGSVALNDEEFASVANGTSTATILSGVLVFLILLIALRSLKIVLPILLTLMVGLVCTTAFALLAVGSLNLISVAFAVMFIGIAVDFGIQFGVRYRDQHHQEPDHAKAMTRTAAVIAIPLSMAAGSTSLGFLAFIPTAYRGVSELGLIAGVGMFIAFMLNITLLPALLALTRPPAEAEAIGYRWLAPVDRFLINYRKTILIVALVAALGGGVIASQIRFDFDPLNLKDPHTESVSTLFDLMKDPDATSYTVGILRPTLKDAQDLAAEMQKLPEVDHAMTLASFVPDDQDARLTLINDSSTLLAPTLGTTNLQPQPDDAAILDALKKTADGMHEIGNDHPDAERLGKLLDDVVAKHDHDLIQRLNKNLIDVITVKLDIIRHTLSPQRLTVDSIPDELRRDWVTPDGRYLVEVYPKGNPRDYKTLIAFTKAVRAVAPDAAGSPISIQESGHTVTDAFIHAGCYAVLAIAFLSFLILRRIKDVVLMLAPLILAGILTLATITIIGLPLNFANIIALPLLLSLGVSYAIYFVSYWRATMTEPLQSSMARAVLFSAATVLVAFGSLALSLHPGTSGMGKLLTVALIYSLISTFLVLPALLGQPKSDKD